MNETYAKIREGWLKDVGYKLLAEQLQLDPEMVKKIYDKWTKESMNTWGWGN